MRISTRGRYGLRFVLDLAQYGNEGNKWVSLKEVSKREAISEKYLWQIADALKSAGIIRVLRGPKGGFSLARSPHQITLKDLFVVLEGDCAVVECTGSPACCERSKQCAARDIWQEVQRKIEQTLDAMCIQDVLDRQKAKEGEIDFNWVI